MPLTNTAIRNARPSEKPVKLFDGGGLYLLLNPNGSRWWRLDYRFKGKRKTLSMGIYPEAGLKEARARRDSARKQLAAGIDPSATRKAEKAARGGEDSLEAVAREWLAKYAPRWAPGHASKIIGRFERDIFPWLGARPVREITAPDLLEVLRRIEAEAPSRQRTGRTRTAAGCSAMRSPRAGPSAIRPQISGVPSRRSRRSTTRRSPTPRPSAPCCVRSTATRARCHPMRPATGPPHVCTARRAAQGRVVRDRP